MFNRIKDVRIDRDINQETVANYLGVDQTTYSRYENGVVDIPINTMKRLAEFYGMSLDYLMELEIEE